MKKIIYVIAFLVISIYASLAQNNNWTNGVFTTGDTLRFFYVNHAKVVYIQSQDSTLTGIDTLGLYSVDTSGGVVMKGGPIATLSQNQATITTFATTMVAGAGLGSVFAWYPCKQAGNCTFTGWLMLARLNVNDNITPFLPKTRYGFTFE